MAWEPPGVPDPEVGGPTADGVAFEVPATAEAWLQELGRAPVHRMPAPTAGPAGLAPLSDARRWVSADGWSLYELGAARLAAGPPARSRRLPEPWDGGERLPDALWEVSSVHDGLGPAGVRRAPFGSPRWLPLRDVAPLTRWMRFGEENILYAPSQWLRFTADASGGWCLSTSGEVRRWDAAGHGLGEPADWSQVWQQLWSDWTAGG